MRSTSIWVPTTNVQPGGKHIHGSFFAQTQIQCCRPNEVKQDV